MPPSRIRSTTGTNVFVSTFAPKARFDAEGNLVGDIDFAEHDTYVKRHAPHGIILFCGYYSSLQGPSAPTSDAYGKAHVQWLQAWVKHLAELGVGYEGFALYPVDEPGLNKGLVETFLCMAKLARQADPKILMYTDPVAGIAEAELREMLPYVDIWCPNRDGLILEAKNAGKLAIIQGSGKPVWTYECEANVKHQTPLGYYRGQAWLAWRHGLTGIGFWSYCTSQDDPWFLPKALHDYLLVYPGNGVVASKRWEAVRDGVEDYAMLATLRQAVEAKGASLKPEDLAAAKRLLGESATSIAGYCVRDVDGSPPPGPAERPARTDTAGRQWAEIQAARHELARLLALP